MFTKNVLICEQDDVFCVIPNCKCIKQSKYAIKQVFDTIDELIQSHNILIDSRCIELIIYSFMRYGARIFVYNVINNNRENVFIWSRNVIKYNVHAYNIRYLHKILFLFLFTNFYMRYITNKPFFQPTNAHSVVMNNPEIFDVKFIMEFINVPYTQNDFDSTVFTHVRDILCFKNIEQIEPLPKEISIRQIVAALAALVARDYVLSL